MINYNEIRACDELLDLVRSLIHECCQQARVRGMEDPVVVVLDLRDPRTHAVLAQAGATALITPWLELRWPEDARVVEISALPLCQARPVLAALLRGTDPNLAAIGPNYWVAVVTA